MARRLRAPLLNKIAAIFVAVWGLASGCNPALINTLGGSPASTSTFTPDGYILIMLMNKTGTSITADVDITKKNGNFERHNFSTPGVYTFATDCDVATIQVVNFGYASTGGLVNVPSNLGVIQNGQGINCGNVMTITASGSPPVFSVQVY